MPSKVDMMLANIEAEELLDKTSQREELIRAKDVAKRQAIIEQQGKRSNDWHESLAKKREDLQARWERIEARRRARIQYYHAKLHHERSQNPSPGSTSAISTARNAQNETVTDMRSKNADNDNGQITEEQTVDGDKK